MRMSSRGELGWLRDLRAAVSGGTAAFLGCIDHSQFGLNALPDAICFRTLGFAIGRHHFVMIMKILILTSFLIVFGNTGIAENRSSALFAKLDRPAVFAGHNTPLSFTKFLNKLNEQETVLVPAEVGTDPYSADVWLLFFRNERDIRFMPRIVQDVYAALQSTSEDPVSRYVEFHLRDGTQKAASFHFLENYSTDNEEVIACKAAVAVYSAVIGNSNQSERKSLTKQCETYI